MKNITYKEEPEKDKDATEEEVQKGGLKEDVEGSTFL